VIKIAERHTDPVDARRMGNGFYLDTDAYYTADGGSLKIQDIAPNISFVNGGSHNTLIVATNDGLIAGRSAGRRRPVEDR